MNYKGGGMRSDRAKQHTIEFVMRCMVQTRTTFHFRPVAQEVHGECTHRRSFSMIEIIPRFPSTPSE